MSEADKILFDCGYEKIFESQKQLLYRSKYNFDKLICFSLILGTVKIEDSEKFGVLLTPNELKAISRKCKELRIGVISNG